MATNYGGRYSKPLGASRHAMGGAAEDLDIGVLMGEGDWITTFDDFTGVMKADQFVATTNWEQSMWVLSTDVGAGGATTADSVSMNDAAVTTNDYSSCIRLFPGTDDSKGGSMKLDAVAGTVGGGGAVLGQLNFPHIWIPEVLSYPIGGLSAEGTLGAAATALDNTSWMFATRVGFRAEEDGTGDGAWEGGFFIGWAASGDTSLLVHDTYIMEAANQAFGFHVCSEGEIYGVSKRIEADAVTAAVGNRVELQPADSVSNTLANSCDVVGQTVWWDLAMRMDITNMSDDDDNGTTRFWTRRVLPGATLGPWNPGPNILTNETPNAPDAVVPHIEVIASAAAGEDLCTYVDWWAFGRNRVNR